MKYFFSYQMPVGEIWLAEEDGKLTNLSFSPMGGTEIRETPVIGLAAAQLREYFNGKRQAFDLPLQTAGTAFQNTVWSTLTTIQYGETRSYGQIAAAAGNPKAGRAVGMANNRNPIAIIIPCHRVIGSDGSLTGYGGGLEVKQKLLALEQKYK